MSGEDDFVLALRVADAGLEARLLALLGGVPGLRLAEEGEAADAVLSDADARAGGPELTPREREVLELLTTGASNRAIGAALGISAHTAKFHVARLLDKLDATGRTDAVAHAARLGVVHL